MPSPIGIIGDDGFNVDLEFDDGSSRKYPREYVQSVLPDLFAPETEAFAGPPRAAEPAQIPRQAPQVDPLAQQAPAPSPAPSAQQATYGTPPVIPEAPPTRTPPRRADDALVERDRLFEEQQSYTRQAQGILGEAHRNLETSRRAREEDLMAGLDEARQRQNTRRLEISKRLDAAMAENQRLGQMNIDPNKFWADRTDHQRFGMVLSAMAGGLLSARTGQPNQAIPIIERMIDRSMEAQKANLANRRQSNETAINLYDHLYRQSESEFEADQRYRAFMWEQASGEYDRRLNQLPYTSGAQQAAAQAEMSGLRGKAMEKWAELRMGQEELALKREGLAIEREKVNLAKQPKPAEPGVKFVATEGGRWVGPDGQVSDEVYGDPAMGVKDETVRDLRRQQSAYQYLMDQAHEIMLEGMGRDPKVGGWQSDAVARNKARMERMALVMMKNLPGVRSDKDAERLILSFFGGKDPNAMLSIQGGEDRQRTLEEFVKSAEEEFNIGVRAETGLRGWRHEFRRPILDQSIERRTDDEAQEDLLQGPTDYDSDPKAYRNRQVRNVEQVGAAAQREAKPVELNRNGASSAYLADPATGKYPPKTVLQARAKDLAGSIGWMEKLVTEYPHLERQYSQEIERQKTELTAIENALGGVLKEEAGRSRSEHRTKEQLKFKRRALPLQE
jgi:hypothetical protein